MPSCVIGNPLLSGAQQIIIGNPWSGQSVPTGGIQFRRDTDVSGNVYIGLSGGTTLNSGGMFLSGGGNSGMLDGMPLGKGDAYFIPRMAFRVSGVYDVYARHDAVVSGSARLYWEAY